jgi:hypothetical protein
MAYTEALVIKDLGGDTVTVTGNKLDVNLPSNAAQEVGGNLAALVTAMTTLTNAINAAGQEKVSLDDIAVLLQRAIAKIESPTYMLPTGEVKVQITQSTVNGTGVAISGTLTAVTQLTTMGAASTDQSFNTWMLNRQIFNDFIKNNIT